LPQGSDVRCLGSLEPGLDEVRGWLRLEGLRELSVTLSYLVLELLGTLQQVLDLLDYRFLNVLSKVLEVVFGRLDSDSQVVNERRLAALMKTYVSSLSSTTTDRRQTTPTPDLKSLRTLGVPSRRYADESFFLLDCFSTFCFCGSEVEAHGEKDEVFFWSEHKPEKSI